MRSEQSLFLGRDREKQNRALRRHRQRFVNALGDFDQRRTTEPVVLRAVKDPVGVPAEVIPVREV